MHVCLFFLCVFVCEREIVFVCVWFCVSARTRARVCICVIAIFSEPTTCTRQIVPQMVDKMTIQPSFNNIQLIFCLVFVSNEFVEVVQFFSDLISPLPNPLGLS